MKKLYFLLLTFLMASISFGQVIITELADPNNDAGARYVEIYNVGSSGFDLTGWELRRWTNGNVDPQTSGVDLSPIGTLSAGSFAIIAANATQFQTVYGFAPDIDAGTGGPADSNGDDQIAIFDASDTTIDIFGVPGEDGSNTCHEFEDGRAERIASATSPSATWNEADWNVWADTSVSGCTSHTNAAQDAPGIFDPGSWIGETTSCGVVLGVATYTCSSNTVGDGNDGVTIQIPYSGSNAGITSVTTTAAGASVFGDDPAVDVDGTIVITGLSEGDAWDITLNGGDCDGTTTSGTVPADECDPAPNTCFDLSGGAELFELVVVTPNSDGDEWLFAAGTYSMNGFVGGAQELVETWLIFGPLDMSSVTDLTLAIDAAENFGTTRI